MLIYSRTTGAQRIIRVGTVTDERGLWCKSIFL